MKRNLLLVIPSLLFAFQYSTAQRPDIYNQAKTKFPESPAVFVDRSETLSILVEGDSLRIFTDVTEDKLYLKEQAEVYSTGRVYGSHFNQVRDIKAKTLVWDKSKFREMNVSDFKKTNDRDAGIFYDDSYYYSFDYPSVAMGNRTQLQYRSLVKEGKFIPGFIFTSYLPQLKTTYTIRTSKNVDMFFEIVNDPKHLINFRKFGKGGFQFYEWTATDVAPRKTEEKSPSIRYTAPHLICYIKSFQTKAGKTDVLSSLDDLFRWYYGFVSNLDYEPSPAIKEIVTKIKSESKSETDVVKNVFYWVQDNIQYVAFEEGMRGLIPHPGAYVCEKRYGDCKDMANLIVSMLKVADIKAYHTWIGTRDLPYKYSEVPTPLVDNHMIATYIAGDGQYYFLDATSDHTPFGLPSSMIQGKEALIGFGPGKYEVKNVPVITKDRNIAIDSVSINIDGNQVIGKGSSSLIGYPKVFSGYSLDRSEKDDVKRDVTRLVGKGSNKFYLDDYTIRDLKDRNSPTRISYSFRIGDYFQKIGDELYINLNLNKEFYNASINTSLREQPMEGEYKFEKVEVCDITIPEGYEIIYLPPAGNIEGRSLSLKTDYAVQGNKVTLTKKLSVDYLLLMPADFAEWNTSIKKISDVYKESLILKKK